MLFPVLNQIMESCEFQSLRHQLTLTYENKIKII